MTKQTRWTHFGEELEAPEIQDPERRQDKRQQGAEPPLNASRIRFLIILLAIFVLAAVTRLGSWQLFDAASRVPRVAAQTIDLSRGRIVDSHGLLMATDTFTWEIYANPSHYREAVAQKQELDLTEIAAKIGVPIDKLTEALAQEGSLAVVEKGVTESHCQAAKNDKEVPGWIWCDGRRKRAYPQGALATHVLGFTDSDQNGLAGVEASYDSRLRTAGSWGVNQLPGQPEQLPEEWKNYLPSPGGRDLVLNIDAALQYLVEKSLAQGVTDSRAKAGAVIVADVRTGGVLALASWPTFDPNMPSEASMAAIVNSAVSEPYEPGSVFKLFTYAGALDTKLITPDRLFTDPGKMAINNKIIYNAENKTYATITARQALASSVNTISARIALDMGQDDFYRYVRQFGFGKPTEIDLGAETPGVVRRPGTEYWSLYDQAANSFGQGLSVTPIQLVSAVSAIANGGTLMQPQIVKGLVLDGQMYRLPPRQMGQAIRPETAHTLTEMMVFTVESYAAGPDLVPGYRVAGKTGTAEIPEREGYTSKLTITSFAGFLPAADPQIVILVKVVEPQTSRWAEAVTLPVFGQVARDAVQVLKIQPDDRMP
jgi:cell division protein FtsI/penicillin-binding protein 2